MTLGKEIPTNAKEQGKACENCVVGLGRNYQSDPDGTNYFTHLKNHSEEIKGEGKGYFYKNKSSTHFALQFSNRQMYVFFSGRYVYIKNIYLGLGFGVFFPFFC